MIENVDQGVESLKKVITNIRWDAHIRDQAAAAMGREAYQAELDAIAAAIAETKTPAINEMIATFSSNSGHTISR